MRWLILVPVVAVVALFAAATYGPHLNRTVSGFPEFVEEDGDW